MANGKIKFNNRSLRLKHLTLKNSFFTYVGYLIPISAVYLGKYLDLTSCTYNQINDLLLVVTLTIGCIMGVVYIKKEMTLSFGKMIILVHYVNWLILTAYYQVVIHEIRILALPTSLIALYFLFVFGNLFASLLLLGAFLFNYLFFSYYAIHHLGQIGTMEMELLHSLAFLCSVAFFIKMAQKFQKTRRQMKKAKREAKEKGNHLEKSNIELTTKNENMRNLINNVSLLSEQVAEESSGITDASVYMVSGANHQGNAISKVSENMVRIKEKINDNTDSALNVNDLVKHANRSTNQGVSQVEQMNNSMEEIRDSGKSISRIVNTINGLAFQTNLLALNASVEAARAGKHGKGFSVVAQEIRGLAVRSATAVDVTGDLLEKVMSNVDNGAEVSEISVEILNNINEKMKVINSYTQSIVEVSREQKDGVARVNMAMENISQVTGKNSLLAQKTNDASAMLSSTVKKVQALLSAYRNNTA